MQSFIYTERNEPIKSDVNDRLKSFKEIYEFFDNRQAALQAERCVQCGDPFCSTIGCPLQNRIPQWLEAIEEQNLEKAFRLSNETSPFPEVLGRVCPQNSLCEGACTLNDGYGAITIGAVEASITDLAFNAGMKLDFPGITTDKKVAVIGSGPASMSCAHFLLRAGIEVHMFEMADKAGGLLIYGIPGFKIDKKIIDNRFAIMKKAGLTLLLNTEVGKDIQLSELQEKYDSIFVGTGATKGKVAGLENTNHENVFLSMSFLTIVQKRLLGKKFDNRFNVRGKNVVVIGGGDTAMDCLRTSLREGAKSVICLYRRDEANMPGSKKEFQNALEEGVVFLFNESPKQIVLNKNNQLVGVDTVLTQMGEIGADGRQKMIEVDDSEHCVPADIVILALGFDIENTEYIEDFGINMSKWGEIIVDPKVLVTNIEDVYAGGDCYRGSDLVVTAATDGRNAAFSIMEKLLGSD